MPVPSHPEIFSTLEYGLEVEPGFIPASTTLSPANPNNHESVPLSSFTRVSTADSPHIPPVIPSMLSTPVEGQIRISVETHYDARAIRATPGEHILSMLCHVAGFPFL